MTFVGRTPDKNSRCKVGVLLDDLPEEEEKALEAMLADSAWNNQALAHVINDEGHDVGRWAVTNHRAQRCACF